MRVGRSFHADDQFHDDDLPPPLLTALFHLMQ